MNNNQPRNLASLLEDIGIELLWCKEEHREIRHIFLPSIKANLLDDVSVLSIATNDMVIIPIIHYAFPTQKSLKRTFVRTARYMAREMLKHKQSYDIDETFIPDDDDVVFAMHKATLRRLRFMHSAIAYRKVAYAPLPRGVIVAINPRRSVFFANPTIEREGYLHLRVGWKIDCDVYAVDMQSDEPYDLWQ